MGPVIWSLMLEGFKHASFRGQEVFVPWDDSRYDLLAAAIYSGQGHLIDGVLAGDVLEVGYQGKTYKVEVPDVVPPVEVPDAVPDMGEEPDWAYLRRIAASEALLKQNLQHLRKYARHDLKIVGASKIPGGKVVLVDRILEARSA